MSEPLFGTRQPPGNPELEMALLGALLANNAGLDRCGPLKANQFTNENLSAVYAAIVDAAAEGRKVDSISLAERFDRDVLVDCLKSFVGHNVVPDYAQRIHELALSRQLIEIGHMVVESAYGGQSPFRLAMRAVRLMDRISMGRDIDTARSLDAAIERVMTAADGDQPIGFSSGFRCIDQRVGPLEPGLVYIIAGRPSMGKSSLANQICLNVARQGVGVLELSLEMSSEQLARRALAIESGLPLGAMRGSPSTGVAERMVAAQQALRGLPLVIDDATGQTPEMLAAKVREARRRHAVGLVMIDHLNLVRADEIVARHGPTWIISQASNAVKMIAKDCSVAVILCVQLNRGPENREDKRPNLGDLRQSGEIEQDGDAVCLVYRPEYYLRSEPEQALNEAPDRYGDRVRLWREHRERMTGRAELIWAKVRDGAQGTDVLQFHGPTTAFTETEGEDNQ